LEISLQSFNVTVLWFVSSLSVVGLLILAYSTVFHGDKPGSWAVWLIFAFYLGLPVLIFAGAARHISRKCSTVMGQVTEAEKKVLEALLT
jgi:hypothetical protein